MAREKLTRRARALRSPREPYAPRESLIPRARSLRSEGDAYSSREKLSRAGPEGGLRTSGPCLPFASPPTWARPEEARRGPAAPPRSTRCRRAWRARP